jgi:hypothetical protein
MTANPPPAGGQGGKDPAKTLELRVPPPEDPTRKLPANVAQVAAASTAPYPQRPDLAPPSAPAPAPPPALPAGGHSVDDASLAAKLQEIVQARTVQKGSEVSVVKLADIIRIVREMLGGFAAKDVAALQDELIKMRLQAQQGGGAAAAEKSRADALQAENERLKLEIQRLQAENERLRAELDKAKMDAAEANRLREEAERARKELEDRVKQLEQILGLTGKSLAELQREQEELKKYVQELDARARSARSDFQYAQLIEEPPFQEMAQSGAELEKAAAKAPPRFGEQARAVAAALAGSTKADGPAWKQLMDEVFARRGSVRTIARLEVLSGVNHALRRELERWRQAAGE